MPISAGSRGLRLAAWLVAAEGAALIALGLSYVGLILAAHPHDRGLALFGAAFALLFGAVLLLAARGLRAFRRAAYSPVVLVQLLAVPVGIGLAQGGRPLIAVAVLVPSAFVLVLLLGTPGGRAVLERGE